MKAKPATPVKNPAFYILMRGDMDSLNPGKAVAQGTHAQSVFDQDMLDPTIPDAVRHLYVQWLAQGGKFGTAITVEVDERQLHQVVEFTQRAGYPAAVVLDDSYPIQDGRTLHLFPVHTCGYVFGDKDELAAILRQFDLYP